MSDKEAHSLDSVTKRIDHLSWSVSSGNTVNGCGLPPEPIPGGGIKNYRWGILGPPLLVRYTPPPQGIDAVMDGLRWWVLVPCPREFSGHLHTRGDVEPPVDPLLTVAVAVRPMFDPSPPVPSDDELEAIIRAAFPRELGRWTENIWIDDVSRKSSSFEARWKFKWRGLKCSPNVPIQWHEESLSKDWDRKFPSRAMTPFNERSSIALWQWAARRTTLYKGPWSTRDTSVDLGLVVADRLAFRMCGTTNARDDLRESSDQCVGYMACRMEAYVGYGAGVLFIYPRRHLGWPDLIGAIVSNFSPVDEIGIGILARSHMPEETQQIVDAVAVHLPVEGVPELVAKYADESALVFE